MGTRMRHWVLGLLMATLTVWPLVQIGLTFRYDLSPWKLAGWGMYAQPRLGASLDVFAREHVDGVAEPLPPVEHGVLVEADRFLQDWRWLRRLVRPDGFARAVFDAFPNYQALQIVVHQQVLDRETGIIVTEPVRFDYVRQPAVASGTGGSSR
jgi:hypothetical protein